MLKRRKEKKEKVVLSMYSFCRRRKEGAMGEMPRRRWTCTWHARCPCTPNNTIVALFFLNLFTHGNASNISLLGASSGQIQLRI